MNEININKQKGKKKNNEIITEKKERKTRLKRKGRITTKGKQ